MTDIAEVNITLNENEVEFQVTATVSVADPAVVQAFTDGLNTLAITRQEVADTKQQVDGVVAATNLAKNKAEAAQTAAEQRALEALSSANIATEKARLAASDANTSAGYLSSINAISNSVHQLDNLIRGRQEDVQSNADYTALILQQVSSLYDAVEGLVDTADTYRSEASFAAREAITAANEAAFIYGGIDYVEHAISRAENLNRVVDGLLQSATAQADRSESEADRAEAEADRAVAAADQVEQDAIQIAQDAAQQAASATIAGVAGQIVVAENAANRAENAADQAAQDVVDILDGQIVVAQGAANRAESEADEAELSAGAAAGSASTASSAAGTAVTASDDAEAALKDFRERYYGRYTTAPTEDPYGGAIDLGDLYFDEVYQELRVWAEVGGTAVWKYAGVGPKGDNFSVHKVGLLSERSLYDDEAQGFCFFATDKSTVHNTLIKTVSLSFSSSGHYLLEEFVGGPQSLVVTVNDIIQPSSAYTVADAGDGDYTLGIVIEPDDTLVAREIRSAFIIGAAYFKLSEVSADWSDPVPFSQGPKGNTGASGRSAYQIWLEDGNTGSIQDFIASFGEDIAVVPPKVYWGLPITGNRKLLEEDIGLSFLVGASVEIELPAWDSLDSGWFINLYPSDFGKKTSYHIVVTTEGFDEIRGGLATIVGDAKVVRSAVAGQFLIIGEIKYVSMEDLQALIFRVEDMNWTNHWYPNWFPDVQVALSRAKTIANNPSSSVTAIAEAYNELDFAIQSLGIRIAYPKPYVIENGNFSGTNTFNTFNDQPEFTVGTHLGAGSVENIMVPEQPKAANTIISQVINNSTLTPTGFLDGTSVFSYYNEVSRFGNQLVGMEFSADRMQNYDVEINILGRVVRKVGGDLNYYTLGVKVYTTLLAGQIKLTVRKYAKVETPTETKEDYVEVSEQFPTSAVLRVGILVDQDAASLRVFSTNGEIVVPDEFLTSDASSGRFSTAFEQYIDSFGLGEIKSTRRSSTTIANIMTFNKSATQWQLEFPNGTMDYAKARLSSFKFIESQRTVEAVPITHKLLKVVNTINLRPPLELVEPQRTVEVVPITHKSVKVVTVAKEQTTVLTEPQRSVEAVTSGNKVIKVVTTLN